MLHYGKIAGRYEKKSSIISQFTSFAFSFFKGFVSENLGIIGIIKLYLKNVGYSACDMEMSLKRQGTNWIYNVYFLRSANFLSHSMVTIMVAVQRPRSHNCGDRMLSTASILQSPFLSKPWKSDQTLSTNVVYLLVSFLYHPHSYSVSMWSCHVPKVFTRQSQRYTNLNLSVMSCRS